MLSLPYHNYEWLNKINPPGILWYLEFYISKSHPLSTYLHPNSLKDYRQDSYPDAWRGRPCDKFQSYSAIEPQRQTTESQWETNERQICSLENPQETQCDTNVDLVWGLEHLGIQNYMIFFVLFLFSYTQQCSVFTAYNAQGPLLAGLREHMGWVIYCVSYIETKVDQVQWKCLACSYHSNPQNCLNTVQ